MDLKDIKKIIELMKQNELSEFELQEEGFRIAVKRGREQESPQIMMSPQAPMMMPQAPAAQAPAPGGAADASAAETSAEEAGWVEIRSPIVGTFYRSSAPDADPFVSVGQEVDEESVVCIVEAMKVMNEIKAEVKGTIRKILLENATPVEYDQPLFLVDPA